MTIQNAPPGLDYDRDKKFSKVLMFFLARVENDINMCFALLYLQSFNVFLL